jgi:predicted nucleic acid-binding Zn ribbon protein
VQPISIDLDRVKRDLLRQLSAPEAAREAWAMVSGSSVAQKTKVVSFEAGVLTIEVPSREWCSELESLRAQYLQKLSLICPAKIESLRFTHD